MARKIALGNNPFFTEEAPQQISSTQDPQPVNPQPDGEQPDAGKPDGEQQEDTYTFDAAKIRDELGIVIPAKRKGRPRNENLVRASSVQDGLTPDWTRATFIVRVAYLEKLKDYAYTMRIPYKKAVDRALAAFLDSVDDGSLLSYHEQEQEE